MHQVSNPEHVKNSRARNIISNVSYRVATGITSASQAGRQADMQMKGRT